MDEEDRKRAILEDDECEARGEKYIEETKG